MLLRMKKMVVGFQTRWWELRVVSTSRAISDHAELINFNVPESNKETRAVNRVLLLRYVVLIKWAHKESE